MIKKLKELKGTIITILIIMSVLTAMVWSWIALYESNKLFQSQIKLLHEQIESMKMPPELTSTTGICLIKRTAKDDGKNTWYTNDVTASFEIRKGIVVLSSMECYGPEFFIHFTGEDGIKSIIEKKGK